MAAFAALLAALINVPSRLGYPALAGLVAVESMGVPVPGETALIASALLARHGQLDIELVIVCAAVGALLGDNLGYVIARKGGRALLQRPGPLLDHRMRILERGEPFFARHGAKAVFLGRWVAVLRIAAAWLAAYLLGPLAEKIVKDVGIAGAAAAALVVAAFLIWRRFTPSG